jgi:hypothetical protein
MPFRAEGAFAVLAALMVAQDRDGRVGQGDGALGGGVLGGAKIMPVPTRRWRVWPMARVPASQSISLQCRSSSLPRRIPVSSAR